MSKNYLVGDCLMLTKEYIDSSNAFNIVGQEFEIANIIDTSTRPLVILRTKVNKVAVGAVSIDVLDEYFQEVPVSSWTDWVFVVDSNSNAVGKYRTNGKKVQYRTTDNKYKGEASCNKMDEFSIGIGFNIACARCDMKRIADIKKQSEKHIEESNAQIKKCDSVLEYLQNTIQEEIKKVSSDH